METLKKFTAENDVWRPVFNDLIHLDGYVYATDTYIAVRKYTGTNEKTLDIEKDQEKLKSLFKKVTYTHVLGPEDLKNLQKQKNTPVYKTKIETCPECSGSGEVKYSYSASEDFKTYYQELECPICKGQGQSMMPDKNNIDYYVFASNQLVCFGDMAFDPARIEKILTIFGTIKYATEENFLYFNNEHYEGVILTSLQFVDTVLLKIN
jgi:hypothetical protein